jgi:hypothetical protein
MDKKILNEDIQNMKYLFGYKPGRVISEQEEPETDRYMFFSNLKQIHRQMGILLEKDPEMISKILDNGHDWAQDHISTAKESIDQVFDFLMNEEKGDGDDDIDDFDREDNEYEDRLPRRMNEQFDDRDHDNKSAIILKRKSSRVVRKFLEALNTEYQDITMLSLHDCESANFSGINICNLPQLVYINLS